MAELTEQTLRTELQEAAKGRPAILDKLQELYHAAPKGSTLDSEVRTHNLKPLLADNLSLDTVTREIKRLGSLLPFLRGDHTKAYIEQLKLLETSLKAEADIIARHAAVLGEALTPDKVQDIANEVRSAAKGAHAAKVLALKTGLDEFKALYSGANDKIIKLSKAEMDLQVGLAKLVGSEEATKILSEVQTGKVIELSKYEATVAEQITKLSQNSLDLGKAKSDLAAVQVGMETKLAGNSRLLKGLSEHIGTETTRSLTEVSTHRAGHGERLAAANEEFVATTAKAAAKAAEAAKQTETALMNKFNGKYKAVGDQLIKAGKTKKLHQAQLVELVGSERTEKLIKSVYTHSNQLEKFSKESPEVQAIVKEMIAHKPVLDGLNKELEALHEAIKTELPARAEEVIAHHTSKITSAVEGYGSSVIGKATSAVQTAEEIAEKAKLVGIHSCELFGHHLELPKAQKEYEAARDGLKPKVLDAYNKAIATVREEITGAAREKAAWDIVANAKDGVFRSNKKAIEEVAKKLTRVEAMEAGIAKFEGLIKEASHGKDVTGLLTQLKDLATHAASEHVSSDHLIHIRNSLDSATSFEAAQETAGKLANDTHGLITKAVEALGKGEKLAGDVAKEGKGNMKWVIGGAVGAAVVGGLALLSGDKPRQKYTDRLNEQQGPVARGA